MQIGTCLLCFAESTKVFNIKNTRLQSVYEEITDSKVHNGCHCLCYICRSKLHQCHLLIKQKLNLQNNPHDDINIEDKCFGQLSTISLDNTNISGGILLNDVIVKKESNFNESECSNCHLSRHNNSDLLEVKSMAQVSQIESEKKTKSKGGRKPKPKIGRPKTSNKTRKEQLREASRRYREKYPERLREATKRYAEKHPEVHRRAVKKYSQKHPEVHRKAVKKYSQKHPEVHRRAVKKYSQKHPEVHRRAVKKYSQKHPEVHRKAVKRYAEKRKKERQAAAQKLQMQHTSLENEPKLNSDCVTYALEALVESKTAATRAGRPWKAGRPNTSEKTRREQQRVRSLRYREKRKAERMATLYADRKIENTHFVEVSVSTTSADVSEDSYPFYCVTVKEEPCDMEEDVKLNTEDLKYEVKIEPPSCS